MEKKKTVRKRKTPKKHIVVFQDANDKVFKTLFVQDGEDAVAPPMKSVQFETKHHQIIFAGWDQDLSSIHSNLVVHPIYKEVPKEFLVMYFHENGKILGTETVPYGQKAKADFHPEKEETEEYLYHFDGWGCDLTHIDSDRMAKAVFREERKQFPVRFFDADGNILLEQQVYYGRKAKAPDSVRKKEDATFYYHFQAWDVPYNDVRKPLDIHPIFQSIYKEYILRFFDEDRLVAEKVCHYLDPVEYPAMWKKGYDFIWDEFIEEVRETKDIKGSFVFSNIKGKQIRTEEGLFEIVNPSVSDGSARLLQYTSDRKQITIPASVKLGDYYYKVESIHRDAFSTCPNVRKIICSASGKVLEEKCFASCKRLQEIVIGENVCQIDKAVFSDCKELKRILWKTDRIMKLKRQTFDRANDRILCIVPSRLKSRYDRILARAVQEKNFHIQGKIIKKVLDTGN